MIDPTIGAAIFKAAGSVLVKLLDLAGKSPPTAKAKKTIDKTYDKLADAVSPNSLRALMALQDSGSFQLPEQIAEKAQGLATRQEPSGKPLEPDITYRLLFLCLLGLIRRGTSDFALTDLGAAFIERARRDKARYTKATAL
jgi:hypothetical protein